MIIDHIGIVVPSLQDGIRHWEEFFGYRQISPIVTNTRQKVRVAFLAKPGSVEVKLIEASEADSPVAQLARRGGGLHHLCFRCADLEATISTLKESGARFLVPPEPGEAFCQHKIAFFIGPGNLNVELIDTDEKVFFTALDQRPPQTA